jgi:hypothetical protein
MRDLWLRAALGAALILSLSAGVAAQEDDGPRGDTLLWPDVQASIKLRPDVRLLLFGSVRFGRDVSAVVDRRVGAGFTFDLGKYVLLTPFYQYSLAQPTPQRRTREHRFYLDLTLRLPLKGGLTLSDRHRGELRRINGALSGRYRNRLQLERPVVIHDYKFTPYLAGELNYDGRFHAWNRNRIYLGARLPVREQVTLDSYYMRQHDGRARPGFLHVVGVIVRLDF